MRIWPYSFEIDLHTYRSRGVLPSDTANPHFYMFLLDDAGTDSELVERHRGTHPMDAHYRYGVEVQDTSGRHRWAQTQNVVLGALRQISIDVRRELEAGVGLAALRECHTRMDAVATEHRSVWEEVNGRINEAISRDRWTPQPPFPTPQTWAEARRRREIRERNMRYGGGYSSG